MCGFSTPRASCPALWTPTGCPAIQLSTELSGFSPHPTDYGLSPTGLAHFTCTSQVLPFCPVWLQGFLQPPPLRFDNLPKWLTEFREVFFFNLFFNWRKIALQCCVGLWYNSVNRPWLHMHPLLLNLPPLPHPTPLGHHRAPGWAPCVE